MPVPDDMATRANLVLSVPGSGVYRIAAGLGRGGISILRTLCARLAGAAIVGAFVVSNAWDQDRAHNRTLGRRVMK